MGKQRRDEILDELNDERRELQEKGCASEAMLAELLEQSVRAGFDTIQQRDHDHAVTALAMSSVAFATEDQARQELFREVVNDLLYEPGVLDLGSGGPDGPGWVAVAGPLENLRIVAHGQPDDDEPDEAQLRELSERNGGISIWVRDV